MHSYKVYLYYLYYSIDYLWIGKNEFALFIDSLKLRCNVQGKSKEFCPKPKILD